MIRFFFAWMLVSGYYFVSAQSNRPGTSIHIPVKIVCIGNSITNGTSVYNSYRRSLWHLLKDHQYNVDFIGSWNKHQMGEAVPDPDFDMDHEGHSGWTADNIFTPPSWDSARGNIHQWLLKYSPDIVLVELGTNDVFQCRKEEDILRDFDSLVNTLRRNNDRVKIFFSNVLPLGEAWNKKKLCKMAEDYGSVITSLNKKILAFTTAKSTRSSSVQMVDQFAATDPAKDLYDDIHPNASGEQLMAGKWFAAIRPYLQKIVPDDFNTIKKSFLNPPNSYGTAPLWVWNDEVTREIITTSLQEFKQKAFGGVIIHPRAGLITPYLSEKWQELYSFAVQEAKKLQLQVWIYDENSYPSGFAGGHVPDDMPESYNQGQMLQLVKSDTLPADRSPYLITLKKENGYYLFKKTFYYRSPWYGGFSYTDLMVKGVTEKFIETTTSAYKKRFGEEFGRTIPGIFSDEPNIEVQYENNIRWTPDLFKIFRDKWGYALEPELPSLFEETGDWKRIRHNYYQVLLQLFIDRWAKPYSSFAVTNHLEWTGHYWEHEWPSAYHVPDNMAMYAWHQRPGIDLLFNQFDDKTVNAQFGNIRAVKELSSVANQLGKKRTLCESYGGGGYELTFKDMKRLGDWQYVLGVNTLVQHLSYMTLKGARKYDYPQSFSYHSPWWDYYQSQNKYFARLSMVLSAGKQKNNIVVIEPTTTAWMYYTRDKPSAAYNAIGPKFQNFITQLEKSQVEYDLASENIISNRGSIEDKSFIIGECSYTTVVIAPGTENLDSSVFVLLQQFAKAGGKILQFSEVTRIDGKENINFNDKEYSGRKKYDSLNFQLISQQLSDGSIIAENDVEKNLYHQRRKFGDGELLFLVNSGIEHAVSGTVSFPGAGALLMDAASGDIFQYPVRKVNGKTYIDFNIEAAGSRLFFFSTGIKKGYPTFQMIQSEGKVLKMGAIEVKRNDNNALNIDFCDLSFGNTILKDQYFYQAADALFKHHGFHEGNPWNTSVQYKDRTIARDTFSVGSGFTVSYHFNVADDVPATLFTAAVEHAELWKVLINGKTVDPVEGKWFLDRSFKVFPVGQFVEKGWNTITLVAERMSIHAEVEPVYILGDFSLHPATSGWDIVSPSPLTTGSWKNQGMPMYAQQVGYTTRIDRKEKNKRYIIQLGKWEGTVCNVLVNNISAGIIAYPPYELDITCALGWESNVVEVQVSGSLKNLIGPYHNKPAPGMVSPWLFRYVYRHPAGKDYEVFDYGLMEPFRILEKKK